MRLDTGSVLGTGFFLLVRTADITWGTWKVHSVFSTRCGQARLHEPAQALPLEVLSKALSKTLWMSLPMALGGNPIEHVETAELLSLLCQIRWTDHLMIEDTPVLLGSQ